MRYDMSRCIVTSILATALLWFTFCFILQRGITQNKIVLADGYNQAVQTERTNIFFLKAHKCASSTVQNILLRYGLDRGLTFVLPTTNNYIGNPELFSADLIDSNYASLTGKYNIFAHHSRYHGQQVRSVMYDDAAFVTILRHPADLYESIYSYYKFQKLFNISFDELLKTPENKSKINRRYFNRIGFNQMSFDLGLPEADFNSSIKVKEFIDKIDEEFDLVMISEWMEASLVLLADLMNWPLENVISLKLNSRIFKSIYVMSDVERQIITQWNHADHLLYTHFLKKFKKRIKEYGIQKMVEQIEKLVFLNSELQYRCVQGTNTKGFGHTQAYKLRDEKEKLCFFAARGELAFTDYLREIQSHRLNVLKRFDYFLNEIDYTS